MDHRSLEVGGVPVPESMTGRSLVSLLKSDKSGQVDPQTIREALGVGSRKDGTPVNLLLLHDTPRARLWARSYGHRLPRPFEVITSPDEGEQLMQVLAFEGETVPEGYPPIPAESLMDGRGLPVAGVFGGTTILVVPATATDEQKAAWKKVEASDANK